MNAAAAAALRRAREHERRGEFAAAEALLDAALARRPGDAALLQALAVLRARSGDFARAAALLRLAVEARPGDAGAQANLGNALRRLGRPGEALAAYDAALALAPDAPALRFNRGLARLDLGRAGDALADFDAALAREPGLAPALSGRGNALLRLRRPAEALAAFEASLAARPDDEAAAVGRANALLELDRLDDALAAFDAALAREKRPAEALVGRGTALRELRRLAEAEACFAELIARAPDHADAHWHLGMCRLQRGDFAGGWPEYEWRWRSAEMRHDRRDFARPGWRGGELAGRTILLRAEQGYGDTIQFCRYAGPVAARGARVVLAAQRPLVGLLGGLAGVDAVVAADDSPPAFDVHCPLLSLPLALGTTLDTIPAEVPYLRADAARVERWRARLPARPGRRIGLAWSGSRHDLHDRHKSIGLRRLAPLLEAAGDATFVGLQKDVRDEDREFLAADGRVLHLGDELGDFADTAALAASMDLVIAVDTSVAHLAGALGLKVWILLAWIGVDWRWLLDRDDSPWYPTARLFRQRAVGDWEGVVRAVAGELARG